MSALKRLERLFNTGAINRREFIARTAALGLTAALSPHFLSKPVQAAVPKKGGRLRAGLAGGATTNDLDPATITDYVPMFIQYGQLRNNLLEVDHTGQVTPELAESFEASPDAKTWTFKLRRGVEFHNGKSLEAADVLFSFRHHMHPDSKSAAKGDLKPIQSVKDDGKDTVVFRLNAGMADFPYLLCDYRLQIVPDGTTDFEKGIGTGPYQLVMHEPGVRCLTKKNPNYWKTGRGHFDEIETICVADVNARTNALKTGQVDFINRCDRKTAHLLKKTPGLQMIVGTGTTHYTIPMLCDVKPFDNNDVRLALKYAVDREMLLQKILRGYGQVGNDHPIGPNQRFFAADLPQRVYDPDKARFHLKKAGLGDYTFKLHTSDGAFSGAVGAAVLYKETAQKAGITIDVVREPADGYWSDVWLKKPWCFCYWGGRPTADWMFSTAYAADSSWNDTHWQHERFNQLLVEARAELDQNKRHQMYAEMQRIVRDEGGVVIPLFASIVEAATNKLKYENYATNYEMDGVKIAERWWFES